MMGKLVKSDVRWEKWRSGEVEEGSVGGFAFIEKGMSQLIQPPVNGGWINWPNSYNLLAVRPVEDGCVLCVCVEGRGGRASKKERGRIEIGPVEIESDGQKCCRSEGSECKMASGDKKGVNFITNQNCQHIT